MGWFGEFNLSTVNFEPDNGTCETSNIDIRSLNFTSDIFELDFGELTEEEKDKLSSINSSLFPEFNDFGCLTDFLTVDETTTDLLHVTENKKMTTSAFQTRLEPSITTPKESSTLFSSNTSITSSTLKRNCYIHRFDI